MGVRVVALIIVLLASACTLSDRPSVTPTAADVPTQDIVTATPRPTDSTTPLPNLPTQNPNALPTRTPLGGPPPTSMLPNNNQPSALPTSATGESATIINPAEGSTVFAGTLQVNGVVSGLAQNQFTLELRDGSENVLSSQTITVQNQNNVREVTWSAAMMTGPYTGAAEVRLIAKNASGQDVMLASVHFTLGSGGSVINAGVSQSSTPYGSISNPVDHGTFSGSTIQVNGYAGGIRENQFTLALVASNGSVITNQTITLTNPTYTNVVPWASSLGTAGYSGTAEIRVSATNASDGSPVVLDTVLITIQ
jgi:hypothetical protein